MHSSIFFGVGALGTISLAWAMGMGCGGSTTDVGDGGLDSTSGGDSTSKDGSSGQDVTNVDGGGGQDAKNNPDGTSDGGGETGPTEGGTPKDGGTGSSTIDCPTAPCGTGLGCCVQLTGDAGLKCESSCENAVQCLTPSDCADSGTATTCCATAVADATGTFPTCLESASAFTSITSTCETPAACPSDLKYACKAKDVLRACASPTDCTETGYPDCCGLPIEGTTLYACVPSLASAFLTCM
jgi:hypothetical protein